VLNYLAITNLFIANPHNTHWTDINNYAYTQPALMISWCSGCLFTFTLLQLCIVILFWK